MFALWIGTQCLCLQMLAMQFLPVLQAHLTSLPSWKSCLLTTGCVVQARCQLGNKYGALIEDCAGLLALAQRLSLQVVGVAFHVGSGATNPQAFADAIAAARLVCPACVSSALSFRKHVCTRG